MWASYTLDVGIRNTSSVSTDLIKGITMRQFTIAGAVCAVGVLAGTAAAAPQFFDQLGGSSPLQPADDTRIEARYRADTTNWDTRLEYDSFPMYGDLTGHVGNGRSFFEGSTFGFELAYDHTSETVTWTISGPAPGSGVLNSLVQPTDSMGQLNTIQIFTVGSRGPVSLTDVAFVGLGMDVLSWPDLDTQPSPPGPTFEETFLFFGESFDLLTGDWTLSGNLSFGTFTKNNPSEGSKITVKLRNAVPSPGAAGVLALGALAAARRRRG
jgi:hypothetical protein